MKYFISHSCRDSAWLEPLVDLLPQIDTGISSDREVFFSSTPETGSNSAEDLLPNIDINMNNSDVIILAVTENYLRSHYCYYELNVASYLKRTSGKKVILLVQTNEIHQRVKPLFPDGMHVSAESSFPDRTFVKAIRDITGNDVNLNDEVRAQLGQIFADMFASEKPIGKEFLGMSVNEYAETFSFVEKYGVERMTFEYPSTPDIISNRIDGAEELIIVSTTGIGILRHYCGFLSKAVANGINLTVVIAERDSEFCKDVGDIEVFDEKENAASSDGNRCRISSEFEGVVQHLNEIYNNARKQSGANIGTVKCCCGYTLVRQTGLVIRYSDSSVWGWITCTMPPARSADLTPSIVIKGNTNTDPFAKVVWKYCKSLAEFAVANGGFFYVEGNARYRSFAEASSLEKGPSASLNATFDWAKEYWTEKYNIAKDKMKDREELYDAVLIEVAAQHPLFRRREPNTEFKKRLDKAIELYHQFTEKGISVSIYVPGSRHKYKDVVDDISLSQAGVNYLLNKGIPNEVLLGEDMNDRYKGDEGVYNSADECYVASRIFFDGEYAKLICICSPNQIMRKSMFYIEFGCFPICYGITTENMYHSDIVNEIFGSLNKMLYFDHSWQDPGSSTYQYFRADRKP